MYSSLKFNNIDVFLQNHKKNYKIIESSNKSKNPTNSKRFTFKFASVCPEHISLNYHFQLAFVK